MTREELLDGFVAGTLSKDSAEWQQLFSLLEEDPSIWDEIHRRCNIRGSALEAVWDAQSRNLDKCLDEGDPA